MSSSKAPKVGDWILHKEPSFDREHEGKVVQLLSMQFVYETEDGQLRHCMFKEMWNKIQK